MGYDKNRFRLGLLLALAGVPVVLYLELTQVLAPVLVGRMAGIHTVMEFAGLAIALMVATLAWNSYRSKTRRSTNLLVAGLIVVATCDLWHTLTYDGMPQFIGKSGTTRSMYYWLVGRFFEVATIAGVGLSLRGPRSRALSAAAGCGLALVVVMYGTWLLGSFPSTFTPGVGLTWFKSGCELVLAVLFSWLAWALWRRAELSEDSRALLLSLACAVSAIGAVAFASLPDPTGSQNLPAHLYKIAAYALVYRAVYLSSVLAPYRALQESEARVRNSEARFKALAANLPNLVLYQMLAEDGGPSRFVQVSDSIERVCGLTAAEVVADANVWYSQLHPDDVPRFVAAEAQARATNSPFEEVARFIIADGSQRTMRIVSAPRRDPATRKTLWDGFLADISTGVEASRVQQRLEAKLREAQKLESLGTLASGIAHDFNNVLAVMLGNIAMVKESLNDTANEERVALEQANKAGIRARNLVRQILTFGRRQSTEMQEHEVASLVEGSVQLLKATLPAGVTVNLQITEREARALVDKSQLEQVVVNLSTNAWHALSDRRDGRIDIGLELCLLKGAVAQSLGLLPGRYLRLTVADNGCGMDSATVQRVFEPFFTTKSVGEGTGLGLAVVHGIVESHRGAIHVESTLGQGTRFDVYLPALLRLDLNLPDNLGALSLTKSVQPPVTNGVAGTGNGEKVLYIDDVEIVAQMVERLLRRANYDVTAAKSPEEGIALFEACPEQWRCVVTDFNMPTLSGLDVVRTVRTLRPTVPTIVTSGYVSDELRSEAQAAGVTLVLEKQNTFEELGTSLQAALLLATAE